MGLLVSLWAVPNVAAQSIFDPIKGLFDWLFVSSQFTVFGTMHTLGYILVVGLALFALLKVLANKTGIFRDNENMENLFSGALALIVVLFTPSISYINQLFAAAGLVSAVILLVVGAIAFYTVVSVSHHKGKEARGTAAEAGSAAEAGAALAGKEEDAAKAERELAKQDLDALKDVKSGLKSGDMTKVQKGLRNMEESLAKEGTLLARVGDTRARAGTILAAQEAVVNGLPTTNRMEVERKRKGQDLIKEIRDIETAAINIETRAADYFQNLRDNYREVREMLGSDDKDMQEITKIVAEMETIVNERKKHTRQSVVFWGKLAMKERKLKKLLERA